MNIDAIAKKDIDRRAFVAASAAATATLAGLSLAGCSENNLQETETASSESGPLEEGAEWIPVSCWHNCGGRCLNKVLVKDGVVLRQKTDDTHEDSWDWPQSRGCIRGRSVQQQVFGADRLKYPMKRKHWEPLTGGDKSLRGRDEWERISWDEALDYIAAELKNAKEKYGNSSILYLDAGLEGYMGGVLNAFGGFTKQTGCQSDGTFEYYAEGLFGVTYGQLNDRYDILNSDYLVMWGNNPAWAAFGNPSYYIKNFKQAGVKFVFVGPDYNASAGFTDAEWIPVRPGGDTALLLAVAYSMITRDEGGSLIDWDFLNNCTVGFDSEHMPDDAKMSENFRDYVLGLYDGVEKTPEWASELCGTPVEKIERLADILGCENDCFISSNGAPARAKGAENFPHALMAVSAMGGHFGKPGNASGLDHNYSTLNRGATLVSLAGSYAPPYQGAGAVNPVDNTIPWSELWNAVVTGKYYDVGVLRGELHAPEERDIDIHVIVSEQKNVLQTQMDVNTGIEAYRKVDFACAQVYTMKTDARYSDIVLPICTRWEYNTTTYYDVATDKENTFARNKAVDPLFESKTDWEIAEAVASRLDVDFAEIMPKTDQQQWMDAMVGATVVKEDGSGYEPLLSITEDDFTKYGVEGAPQVGRIPLEQFLRDGVYRVKRSADDPFVYIALKEFRDDPETNPLPTTASGKLEIYCQAKGDLFAMMKGDVERIIDPSPLPKYMDQHEGFTDTFIDWENKVRGPYPFQLTHVHYLRRAHSDMDNLPWLREAMTNPVFINKSDAEEKGIEDGDIILVHNDNGAFIRPASVSRTVMPGVIAIPHGAAVCIDEATGIDTAGADNVLTSSCNETAFLSNGWNGTLVDYEKYTGDIELLPDCDWPLDIPLPDEE